MLTSPKLTKLTAQRRQHQVTMNELLHLKGLTPEEFNRRWQLLCDRDEDLRDAYYAERDRLWDEQQRQVERARPVAYL